MKRYLLVLPLAVVAFGAFACGGDEGDVNNITVPPPGPTLGINVSGEGRVTVEPDLARLNLGVEVQRDSADAALVDANGAFENLQQVLEDEGVAEEDIQTTGVTVQPVYNYNTDPPTITGYIAANTVEVKVRDLESVGPIIDGATSAAGDAVRVNYITFEREDRDEANSQARELAAEDARQKAEALAEAAGVELGALQTLSETSLGPTPPIPFDEFAADRAEAEAGGQAVPQTNISPGTLEVVINVVAVYGIDE
jgi:uncharacterized protein